MVYLYALESVVVFCACLHVMLGSISFFFFFLSLTFCKKLCSMLFFLQLYQSSNAQTCRKHLHICGEKNPHPTPTPDCPTFNHYVMFSNELNESFLPSLSLTSNIYCWRCLWAAGGVAGGWRGLEEHRTLQCASAKEPECGPSSAQP